MNYNENDTEYYDILYKILKILNLNTVSNSDIVAFASNSVNFTNQTSEQAVNTGIEPLSDISFEDILFDIAFGRIKNHLSYLDVSIKCINNRADSHMTIGDYEIYSIEDFNECLKELEYV